MGQKTVNSVRWTSCIPAGSCPVKKMSKGSCQFNRLFADTAKPSCEVSCLNSSNNREAPAIREAMRDDVDDIWPIFNEIAAAGDAPGAGCGDMARGAKEDLRARGRRAPSPHLLHQVHQDQAAEPGGAYLRLRLHGGIGGEGVTTAARACTFTGNREGFADPNSGKTRVFPLPRHQVPPRCRSSRRQRSWSCAYLYVPTSHRVGSCAPSSSRLWGR